MAIISTRSFQSAGSGVLANLPTGNQSGADIVTYPGGSVIAYGTGDGPDRRLVLDVDDTLTDLGLSLQDYVLSGDPSVMQLQDGRIVVTFAGEDSFGTDDVYAILYDPATGDAEIGYVPSTETSGTDPETAALQGGQWVMVFTHANSGTVQFQLMDGLDRIGSDTIITDANSPNDATVTALDGGGFVVTWTENNGGNLNVMGAVYDDQGNVVTAPFEISVASLYDDQSQSAVLALPDGGFLVAMTDTDVSGSQIYIDAFAANGSYLNASEGFAFLVPSEGRVVGEPEMAFLPNGEFIVTWTNEKPDGETEIRAAVFAIGDDYAISRVPVSIDNGAAVTDFSLGDLIGHDTDPSLFVDPQGFLMSLFTTQADPDGTGIGGSFGAVYTHHLGDHEDDTLLGDMMIDVAQMGDGADTVLGLGGADQLYGDGGEDTLLGGAGDDYIAGGADADVLIGGDGSDTLDYADSVLGVTINLTTNTASGGDAAGDIIAGFENVIGTDKADKLTGNSAINLLIGGLGGDTLVAVGNGDTLTGGVGDDIYVLGSFTADLEEFGPSTDIDTVTSTIGRSLAIGDLISIENLTLLGTGNGTGNGLANIITGSNSANTLMGMDGKDTLIGGLGKDTLTGGKHDDIFKFTLKTHSSASHATADIITDFDDAGMGNDKIDLSGLFGPKMNFIKTAAFTKAGQVRVNDIAGADLIIEVNTEGSLAADVSIRLKNTTLSQIGLDDFVL